MNSDFVDTRRVQCFLYFSFFSVCFVSFFFKITTKKEKKKPPQDSVHWKP